MNNILGLNSTRTGESRGVSPVIATVLVVAIVVIISASIAAVTLGYTDQLSDPAPTTAFEFDYEDGWEITHTQGESIDADALQIRIDDPDGVADNVTDWPGTGTVSAGTSVKVDASDTTGNEDVSVIWEDGSNSYSIGSTGSSSGSGSGGGGAGGASEGAVANLGGSFEYDTRVAGGANDIMVQVTDGSGDPVEGEEITIRVDDPDQGILSAFDEDDVDFSPIRYDNQEELTVVTGSDGRFETATGSGADMSVSRIQFGPIGGALSPGDEVSVELEANSNGETQTITYEVE
jgi:flagellin-like protein